MERRMGLIAAGIATRGGKIHVAYIDGGDNSEDIELNGVILHPIKAAHNYDIVMVFRLFTVIRKVKPDIIQTWSLQMDIIAGIIARILKLHWIIMESTSEMAYTGFSLKISVRNFLSRKSIVVANSSSGETYWRNKNNLTTHIIRNGQQVQRILDTPPYNRAQLPVNDIDILFLFVGRLNATAKTVKNFQTCLDVISSLTKYDTPVKLLVCGDGSERSFWEGTVAALGLIQQVIFLKYLKREEVWRIMKIATGLLSVSFYEGCPNVVQEAMLCKCPLIVSNIAGHREILTTEDALLVDPHDSVEIRNAVVELFTDKEQTSRRVAHAFSTAQHFTIDNMLDHYEKLYLSLSH
jgi:glycosyltransferase involved in cell wall biosynthesis